MSTTQTSHEPDPGELEHVAAQSEGRPRDSAQAPGHEVAADHDAVAADHDAVAVGHDAVAAGHDEHAHGGEALGPIDVQAWGALALGIAAGLLIVLCLVITNSLVAKPVI